MTLGPVDLPDWTRAYLLMGQDVSGNPLPLLLDANGQLIALLQGQIAGVKTTISVDANGRIESFVLDDESQWGTIVKTGNSELAARLGSVLTYDWRGQVLYSTTFENGFGLGKQNPQGTGSSIALDPAWWMSGGFSALLKGGSDGLKYAQLSYNLTYPPSGRVGVQTAFSCWQDAGTFYLTTVRDGPDTKYTGKLALFLPADILYYLNDGGTWTKIADVNIVAASHYFYHIKLVVDFTTGEYVRCLFADTEYDLSGNGMTPGAGTGKLNLLGEVVGSSRAANNDRFYVDHFAITLNEPDNE